MTKESKKLFLIIVLGISLLGVLIYIFLYTNINLTGDTVTSLYAYLGNDNITSCRSDLFYSSGSATTYSTMDSESLICNAYLYIEDSGVEVEVEQTSEEEGTCVIDALLLAADYNKDVCSATKYTLDDMLESYYTIYGINLESYEQFSLSNGNVCTYNEVDNNYYCYASAEETTVSLSSAITYRLLKSAVDVYDGTIVIKDYFLNIVDGSCYTDITNESKNYDCTTYIEDFSDLQIDSKFMKSYSGVYEHTFEIGDDGEYHWISSVKIN